MVLVYLDWISHCRIQRRLQTNAHAKQSQCSKTVNCIFTKEFKSRLGCSNHTHFLGVFFKFFWQDAIPKISPSEIVAHAAQSSAGLNHDTDPFTTAYPRYDN